MTPNTKSGRNDFEPTTLGYALLGTVRQQPQSGYEIRRLFEETPMSSFSSSPGSIYPALRRLVQEGLLVRADRAGTSRQVFDITTDGIARLKCWLNRPIESADVRHRYEALMLQLAFMEGEVPPRVLERFVAGLARETEAWAAELSQYIEDNRRNLPFTGLLALEQGLAVTRARAQWAADSHRALRGRSNP